MAVGVGGVSVAVGVGGMSVGGGVGVGRGVNIPGLGILMGVGGKFVVVRVATGGSVLSHDQPHDHEIAHESAPLLGRLME